MSEVAHFEQAIYFSYFYNNRQPPLYKKEAIIV
jgi:hypothetical protein